EVQTEGRWELWTDLVRLAPSFPVLGSGYGTLIYVEPLERHSARLSQQYVAEVDVDHAHNDYLEALVQGRVGPLVPAVGLGGLVLALGYRALRRYANRTPGAWAFGGLVGVLALALHSFVDFSATTPAVACLATVLAAQLISLGRTDPTVPPSAAHMSVLTLRL